MLCFKAVSCFSRLGYDTRDLIGFLVLEYYYQLRLFYSQNWRIYFSYWSLCRLSAGRFQTYSFDVSSSTHGFIDSERIL